MSQESAERVPKEMQANLKATFKLMAPKHTPVAATQNEGPLSNPIGLELAIFI